jgi:GH43 family beta-xylosidase
MNAHSASDAQASDPLGGRLYDGYFADPFVLATEDGYVAVGTGGTSNDRVFEALTSADLLDWASHGTVLERLPASLGDQYWAPEIAAADGRYWMYYSIGHGTDGHHLRVAGSESPLGPYIDLGVDLTPNELFAIDPHPFRDVDGGWYLFFARDVLDDPRPGTQLTVAPLTSMTSIGTAVTALAANADWQIYERERPMYGSRYTWHTLEGPSVVRRHGRYWMTYSGGAWTGDGYGVDWAVADSPLGPWAHPASGNGRLLSSGPGLIGPGHNSLTVDPSGEDVIVFHAWNPELTSRNLFARQIRFEPDGPRLAGPLVRRPSIPSAVS